MNNEKMKAEHKDQHLMKKLMKIKRLSGGSRVHQRFWESIDDNIKKIVEDLRED